jgi:hypothetical protein
MVRIKKDKKGWLRIVEAFLAILLITTALLIIIGQGSFRTDEDYQKIYATQTKILREIELDSNMRTLALGANVSNPGDNVPEEIKDFVNQNLPNNLDCELKICKLEKICTLEEYLNENIYSQSVAIVSNSTNYSPRQLKMFCWTE